jgi:hypothetical protein
MFQITYPPPARQPLKVSYARHPSVKLSDLSGVEWSDRSDKAFVWWSGCVFGDSDLPDTTGRARRVEVGKWQSFGLTIAPPWRDIGSNGRSGPFQTSDPRSWGTNAIQHDACIDTICGSTVRTIQPYHRIIPHPSTAPPPPLRKRGHGLTVPRFEGLMTKPKKKITKPFRVQMQLI